jgi:O-antigen ligase
MVQVWLIRELNIEMNLSLAKFGLNSRHAGIPFTILLALFIPGHMFNWAIEWIWLGIQILISFFWFFYLKRKFKPVAGFRTSTWLWFCIICTFLGMQGMLASSLLLDMTISTADIPDLLKFLIYLPLALFIGSAIRESDIEGVTLALKLVVLFNLVSSAILIFDVPILSNALMLIYADAKVTFDLGYIRIGIPFTNPNYAAMIFVLMTSYFFFFVRLPIFGILCLVSLFLTGSRSGFIAVTPIIILAYLFLLHSALSTWRYRIMTLVFHLVPLYYLSNLIEASEEFSRIFEFTEAIAARDISTVETASIRIDIVKNAIGYISRSPLFGVGPGRSYGLDVTDSQLISWPLIYGIPGAILIGSFFSLLFINIARRSGDSSHIFAAYFTLSSFLLMLATGDFMQNNRLFFLTVLFAHCMGLIAAHSEAGRLKVMHGK